MYWISGFAKAKGGVLYIGKNDNGNVVGVSNYKRLMDDLPNKISSKLGVVSDINLHEKDGLFFIEIVTNQYNNGISYNGNYYYRSGSTNQELRGNELTEFLLRKTGKTWDDINEDTVRQFVKSGIASKRLPPETESLDTQTIFENLLIINEGKLTRSALKILFTRFINSSISYDGIQRIETYEYPYEAVREILLNAFTHRPYENSPIQISVYDDHIMFWNQELYEVSDRTALRHLDELVKLNVLIKVGEKKGTRYEIKH